VAELPFERLGDSFVVLLEDAQTRGKVIGESEVVRRDCLELKHRDEDFDSVRHVKKRLIVFTTNKALADWGVAVHDRDLACASIDRVLERGHYVLLKGPSMHTRHLHGLDYES